MKKLLLVLSLVLIIIIAYRYIAPHTYLLQSAKNYRSPSPATLDAGIAELNVPEGFIINYFARDVEGARSLAVSDSGIVYVGSRKQGNVYALIDHDKDFVVDDVVTVADGLNSPNGVVWHNGDLYVAEIQRVIKFADIDDDYSSNPTYEVIYDGLPTDAHHGWRYMSLGPDNKLYIAIGAPCNVCDEPGYATINRLNLDGSEFEIVARGIRNSVGFDWHPVTQQLYFTDNGRDQLGDDIPPDELNVLSSIGEHFGFPYCHGSEVQDPQFGQNVDCNIYSEPLIELGPHVAALGLHFYNSIHFPREYRNLGFIAEHGSWNRTDPIGYRVSVVDVEQKTYQPFVEGWLDEDGNAWGRPVDIKPLSDGSLLVSDDLANAVYRISSRFE